MMSRSTFRLGVRRVFAFCIDYVFIALYISALVFINLGILDTTFEPQADVASKLRGHAIAFTTMTFPLWLYFTLQEAGSKAATFGKRVMKLKVKPINGKPASFAQIALRNTLRLLPWEFAHAAIWYVPGRPFIDAMPPLNLAVCVLANGLAVGFVIMLFVGVGRTPYDRISRTVVTG